MTLYAVSMDWFEVEADSPEDALRQVLAKVDAREGTAYVKLDHEDDDDAIGIALA